MVVNTGNAIKELYKGHADIYGLHYIQFFLHSEY
jgi:hypothetical protein